jgi:hypothetical protein
MDIPTQMFMRTMGSCMPGPISKMVGEYTWDEIDDLDRKVCSSCITWRSCNIRANKHNARYRIHLVDCSIVKKFLEKEEREPIRPDPNREPIERP